MKDFKIYYGMEFNPFEKGQPDIEIDTDDFKEAIGRLNYLKDIRGIGLFTGRSGTGKTFIMKSFSESDEAQYLKTAILNDLIMLLNFNFDSSNYVILIMTGTPVLNHTINRAVHEALKQRIVIQYEMSGMNEDDIGRYIIEKLKKAGRTQPLILPEAVKALSNACQGSSRKLNNLLTHCLIIGAAREKMTIDNEIVMEAANEIG